MVNVLPEPSTVLNVIAFGVPLWVIVPAFNELVLCIAISVSPIGLTNISYVVSVVTLGKDMSTVKKGFLDFLIKTLKTEIS